MQFGEDGDLQWSSEGRHARWKGSVQLGGREGRQARPELPWPLCQGHKGPLAKRLSPNAPATSHPLPSTTTQDAHMQAGAHEAQRRACGQMCEESSSAREIPDARIAQGETSHGMPRGRMERQQILGRRPRTSLPLQRHATWILWRRCCKRPRTWVPPSPFPPPILAEFDHSTPPSPTSLVPQWRQGHGGAKVQAAACGKNQAVQKG